MIELVSTRRCIGCDKCVEACPTNVFDRGPDGVPEIARQEDCQTCFQCEANCPVDALFVAASTAAEPADSAAKDEEYLASTGLLGSYRARIGWGQGRTPGSRLGIGPNLNPGAGESGIIIS